MPRNAEVIRHWQMLLHIDAMRAGVSVKDLAAKFKVTTRTVWRDLQALQEVGFPLVDEKRDRTTCWKLLNMPLKALNDAGLSVTEACSLYLSRTLLVEFTGTPFEPGLAAIIRRVEKSLSPAVRKFLQRLPEVVQVKGAPRKTVTSPKHDEFVARLIEAATERKVCRVLYFSVHSDREKEYELHPYSLTYAEGGLYLSAWVPEYRMVRVFAAERVRKVTVLEKSFTPGADMADEAFGQSLGVNRGGKPEKIVVEFTPRVASYVRERTWHGSQQIEAIAGGGVRLTLKVCRDWALRTWVLGWGAHARVVSPSALAEEILEQLDGARDGYAPKLLFDAAPPSPAPKSRRLPLRS
ncbi:YafY family protein [Luteitalea sp.]|uniref:helix-turn-helix transcriptional regulator n=1 Tax=Luteitalea sp. TaxID=2004800 RepID=UPI0025BD3120|nr:transcriptional regulator [Luteitalea sp.]